MCIGVCLRVRVYTFVYPLRVRRRDEDRRFFGGGAASFDANPSDAGEEINDTNPRGEPVLQQKTMGL